MDAGPSTSRGTVQPPDMSEVRKISVNKFYLLINELEFYFPLIFFHVMNYCDLISTSLVPQYHKFSNGVMNVTVNVRYLLH